MKQVQAFASYRQVIGDYFYEFAGGFRKKGLWQELPAIAALGLLWGYPFAGRNWLVSLPLLFALLSGLLHKVSLPFMMYLVPCSAEQREVYIRRMLHVKVAVPMAFGLLWGLAGMCLSIVPGHVLLLELASIFFFTSLCGMLGETAGGDTERVGAYGGMRYFVGGILVVCYLGGVAMCVICTGPVSTIEFRLILSAMLLFLLPMTAATGRRWKRIRRSLADYELAEE